MRTQAWRLRVKLEKAVGLQKNQEETHENREETTEANEVNMDHHAAFSSYATERRTLNTS